MAGFTLDNTKRQPLARAQIKKSKATNQDYRHLETKLHVSDRRIPGVRIESAYSINS